MLKNVLTSIITHEFEKNVGKNQDPMFSKKTDDNFYAMDIELRLSTFKEEEGYRHLHIRIYGPHNYVAVLVKENWDVIPEGFIDYVNDCLFPGKDYTKSDTGWMLASYHDSCWTTDGVDSILYAYGNRITGIDTIGCGDGWYKKVSLTVNDRQEIEDLIHARDSQDFSKHWHVSKTKGPLFGKDAI